MSKDHNDTVIGLRQKGTENWGYEDTNGKLAFGPLSARTLFFAKGAQEMSQYMSKASGTASGNIEQVPVRRRIEVLESETA